MNLMKTGMLMAAMTALFLGIGFMAGGSTGMMLALAFAIATNVFTYWNADKMVLRMAGAREVSATEEPAFHAMVARLARNAKLPMPKLFIIESAEANAFATGRNPENAAVAATSGLLRQLSAEEVEGVMAHELAHVKNRDTLIMAFTATLSGAVAMLANFGFLFGGRDRNAPGGVIGQLLLVIVAPLAAAIVQMAISRTREYAADREGAEISGNPLALASALQRISQISQRGHARTGAHDPAIAHLFIINPLAGFGAESLFSTHPKTENRIAALRAMANTAETSSTSPGPWETTTPTASSGRNEPTGPWG